MLKFRKLFLSMIFRQKFGVNLMRAILMGVFQKVCQL
jgi:hypothetical protein